MPNELDKAKNVVYLFRCKKCNALLCEVGNKENFQEAQTVIKCKRSIKHHSCDSMNASAFLSRGSPSNYFIGKLFPVYR